MRLLADIEGNDLLYGITNIWCVCFIDQDSGQEWDFTPDNLDNLPRFLVENKPSELVFHNGIGFDLPALKKILKIDYTIEPDTLLDFKCKHIDTLLLSKILNPDRDGHSLEDWGNRLGYPKGNYSDWSRFTPEMLEYCKRDVKLLGRVLNVLEREMNV